jgi:hypothetical protein
MQSPQIAQSLTIRIANGEIKGNDDSKRIISFVPNGIDTAMCRTYAYGNKQYD